MSPDKSIGGYFGLDFTHNDKWKSTPGYYLNTGRNCLEQVIRCISPSTIWMPRYTCGVLREPFVRTNVDCKLYSLDEKLSPIIPFKLRKDELLLYTNYFGICHEQVNRLLHRYSHQLIIDNAQAYYDKPGDELACFYSPRKFFGLPDGGILFFKREINIENYDREKSINRISHLIKRLEIGPEAGYEDFLKNDKSLKGSPIKRISMMAEGLMSLIDTDDKRLTRIQNFYYLHNFFRKYNELHIPNEKISGPLCYPLLIKGGKKIKEIFVSHRIFTPTYWPDVLDRNGLSDFEQRLIQDLVNLPIDHRYGENEMKHIIEVYKQFIES